MKFHWGHGIAVFYIAFMFVLLMFVFKSTTYDHTLVMDNYYEQDLKYQQHYDKVANQMALVEGLVIAQNEEAGYIRLAFPAEMHSVEGSILLFRPSASHKDISTTIELDDKNNMLVRTHQLARGRWILKADWVADGVPYYKEMEIVL